MHVYTAGLMASPGQAATLGGLMTGYRDALSEATDLPWSAWAVIAGQPYGSFGLSVLVNGIGELIEGQMKAAASQRFQELSAQSVGVMAGPAEVNLNEIVAIAGDDPEVKSIVEWTRATLAGGHLADGMAWAVEMMEYAAKLTGAGGAVATSGAGQLFSVQFISSYDTGQLLDEAHAKVNGDAEYMSRLDAAGDFFVSGSVERMISVRMP